MRLRLPDGRRSSRPRACCRENAARIFRSTGKARPRSPAAGAPGRHLQDVISPASNASACSSSAIRSWQLSRSRGVTLDRAALRLKRQGTEQRYSRRQAHGAPVRIKCSRDARAFSPQQQVSNPARLRCDDAKGGKLRECGRSREAPACGASRQPWLYGHADGVRAREGSVEPPMADAASCARSEPS